MRLIAVDDEPLALRDLIETMQGVMPEAVVEGFRDPLQALASAQEAPVDVAFLDIEMGAMDGLTLAKALKDLYGRTNIVFVTAHRQYAADAFSLYASGYLLKPVTEQTVTQAMEHLRTLPHRDALPGMRVQTFGNFEVFVDGRPLRFARSKAKELLAYLIHKRGTSCGTRELAAVLFEDQPYTLSLQKQIQTILSSMLRTLREAGVSDCITRSYNRTAVNPDKIDCDYYRFLQWDMEAVNQYMGEYMTNYSWAEFVTGYLDQKLP